VENAEKRVPEGGALLPNACSIAPPKKAQLRAPLSPLQMLLFCAKTIMFSVWLLGFSHHYNMPNNYKGSHLAYI